MACHWLQRLVLLTWRQNELGRTEFSHGVQQPLQVVTGDGLVGDHQNGARKVVTPELRFVQQAALEVNSAAAVGVV